MNPDDIRFLQLVLVFVASNPERVLEFTRSWVHPRNPTVSAVVHSEHRLNELLAILAKQIG